MRELPVTLLPHEPEALLAGRLSLLIRRANGAPTGAAAYLLGFHAPSGLWGVHADVERTDGVWRRACPMGVPGDHLWGREPWACTNVFPGSEMVVYRAGDSRTDYGGPWRQALAMPRSASRFAMRVDSVRLLRLQQLTSDDCSAAGCGGGHGVIRGYHYNATPQEHFDVVWHQLYGRDGARRNPWVWAVSVQKLDQLGSEDGR